MGIFDLLKKREAERELSAQEYVDTAIRLEATGKTDEIDVGKLESHLSAIGTTADEFADAVERRKEIDRLRSVVDGKEDAVAQFKELASQAKTIREDTDLEISRLNTKSAAADVAAGKARAKVDAIRAAETELRSLMDTAACRGRRTELKGTISAHVKQYDKLATRIRQLGREVRTLTDIESGLAPSQREELVNKREELARLTAEHKRIEDTLNGENAQLAAMESELIEV